eukprot:6981341-Alexandrium_andersonii.AAC.1
MLHVQSVLGAFRTCPAGRRSGRSRARPGSHGAGCGAGARRWGPARRQANARWRAARVAEKGRRRGLQLSLIHI